MLMVFLYALLICQGVRPSKQLNLFYTPHVSVSLQKQKRLFSSLESQTWFMINLAHPVHTYFGPCRALQFIETNCKKSHSSRLLKDPFSSLRFFPLPPPCFQPYPQSIAFFLLADVRTPKHSSFLNTSFPSLNQLAFFAALF